MNQTRSAGLRRIVIVGLAFCLFASSPTVHGWAQTDTILRGTDSKHAGEFLVALNKSQILQTDVPFAELLVGNSEIADVLALTDRSIYVLGKTFGATSLMIHDRAKVLIAVLDLVVTPDVEGLKARLFELLPEETIEVRSINGSLALSGTVPDADRLSMVLALAEQFAPGRVLNLLAVDGSQQVMLKVRFIEVSRTVMKELGVNFDLFDGDFSFTSGDTFLAPGNVAALRAGGPLALLGNSFGVGALLGGAAGGIGLSVLFEALEAKGLAKTLAEPNLTALSGDTASFLAGGEFPIEVVQGGGSGNGDGAITIEFKEFGVSLAFTPTVLRDGLINLVVSPEVSALDFSVAINGVPGLVTRRATTTIELRDGQAFAIAGLLQDNFQDTIRQVPLLGDIPILGALFRSSSFQKNETELVIIVEPHLVKPAPARALATPVDNFIPPSEADIWLYGRIEAPGSRASRGQAAEHLAKTAGGFAGPFGHIIK